ncbi:MAG: hypothetical protein ACPG4T_14195, partial [Nannocystaceae bacterium]
MSACGGGDSSSGTDGATSESSSTTVGSTTETPTGDTSSMTDGEGTSGEDCDPLAPGDASASLVVVVEDEQNDRVAGATIYDRGQAIGVTNSRGWLEFTGSVTGCRNNGLFIGSA